MAKNLEMVSAAPVKDKSVAARITLADVGNAGLSGLSKLGNLLDIPGSMVRDTLVWDNPFDQFLSPLSHYQTGASATGRDVLARNLLTGLVFTPNKETGISGWADDPVEGVQDVAGFATELALDPLAWLTGFTSKAPGTAGKVGMALTKGTAFEKAVDAAMAVKNAAAAAPAPGAVSATTSALDTAGSVLNKGGYAEAAFNQGWRGKFDKVTHAVNKVDPGFQIGRKMRQFSDTHKVPDWIAKNVSSPIVQQLNKRLPKSVQLGQKQSPVPSPLTEPKSGFPAGLTPYQELQFLIAGKSAGPGAKIVEDLSPEMDLARRIGNSFGAEVYFWGGDAKTRKANGVRRHDIGNRIWISEYAKDNAYIDIVGHELVHAMRDASQDTFDELVRIIERDAPEGVLAKNIRDYMAGYKKVYKRDLHEAVQQEEGVARTVQHSFVRESFWEEIVNHPKIGPEVQKAYQQVMDKIRQSGKLPEQEFKVLDTELSRLFVAKREVLEQGATLESLQAARPYLFMQPDAASPLDAMLSAVNPQTKAGQAAVTIADITSRINTGIQAAMNYKVRGHTHPVVQQFAMNLTNGSEALQAQAHLPIYSLAETVSKLADDAEDAARAADTPFDRVTFVDDQQRLIRHAIEKEDFSILPTDLQPATRQLQRLNQAFQAELVRAGLKRSELADVYVEHYPRRLHPAIEERLNAGFNPSGRPPADLAVNNRSSQSHRTMLFRDAYGGTDTWNTVTVDPQVLDHLTAKGVDYLDRVENAADHLRGNHFDDIDPRIPVVRSDGYGDRLILVKQFIDDKGNEVVNQIPVTFQELSTWERMDSVYDLNTTQGRLQEHLEPIRYRKSFMDDADNVITEEYELLTGRKDDLYDNLYKDPDEKLDRYQVLTRWMHNVGADTLKKTTGAFSGNALNDAHARFNNEIHTLQALQHMPDLLLSAMRKGVITAPHGNPGVSQAGIPLKDIFGSEYFSRADRRIIYNKIANMDPVLNQLSQKLTIDQFVAMFDNLRADKAFYRDLIDAGAFLRNTHKSIDDILKISRSAGSLWKAGVLTHPARYVRDFFSGMAALMYSDRFSASAFQNATDVLFNRPNAELLNYGPVKAYLDEMQLAHTPENASRAVRQMYGTFKGGSGSIYRDFIDDLDPRLDASNGLDALMDPLPGAGYSGFNNMMAGAGNVLRGREGGTWNPFDIAGVQHVTEKVRKAPDGTDRITPSGTVRTESDFIPLKTGNLIGKHTDDMNRLVGFVEGLRRGEAPSEAWQKMSRIQLDYDPKKFAPLEVKVLKKIFPFYSFMSRQSAYLATELMTNPAGRLGNLIRVLRNQQTQENYLPEHITEGVAIPLRTSEDGTQNYITGLGLMFEDPVKLLMPDSPEDLTRNLLARSSPLIKGFAEFGLGRSAFQGGPLGGRDLADMDPVLGRIFTQLGLQSEGPGGQAKPAFGSRTLEFVASNSPVSRILSSTKTLLDNRKTLLERAVNVSSGVRITSVSPEQQQRGIRELTNAIAKDLGSRAFTTYHISEEMLEDARQNSPEKYEALLAIKEMRKEWDAKQREKRKLLKKKEAEGQ